MPLGKALLNHGAITPKRGERLGSCLDLVDCLDVERRLHADSGHGLHTGLREKVKKEPPPSAAEAVTQTLDFPSNRDVLYFIYIIHPHVNMCKREPKGSLFYSLRTAWPMSLKGRAIK